MSTWAEERTLERVLETLGRIEKHLERLGSPAPLQALGPESVWHLRRLSRSQRPVSAPAADHGEHMTQHSPERAGIVERLRRALPTKEDWDGFDPLMAEAADEIERLRSILRDAHASTDPHFIISQALREVGDE